MPSLVSCALVPLLLTGAAAPHTAIGFRVTVANDHVAPVEISVSYTARHAQRLGRVEPGATTVFDASWEDRPFVIVVRVTDNGLFDARGGAGIRQQHYYTDHMTVDAGGEVTVRVPQRIDTDPRFRTERP